MGTVTEKKKLTLSSEELSPEDLFETNDLKLATAMIASGHGLVMVRHILAQKGNSQKPEILFGFRQSQRQHDTQIAFLSGQLSANALGLLDTRDRLISYIANGHRSILNPITEEVVSRAHG